MIKVNEAEILGLPDEGANTPSAEQPPVKEPEAELKPENKPPVKAVADMTAQEIFSHVDKSLNPQEEEEQEVEVEEEKEETLDEPVATEAQPEIDEFGIKVPKTETQPEVPPAATDPQPNTELVALREEVAKLTQAVQEKPKTQTAVEQQAAAHEEAVEIAGKYNFKLQPEMFEEIRGEDEDKARAALETAFLGTAMATHKQIRLEMATKIAELEQRLSNSVTQATRPSAQSQADLFYAEYPQLNVDVVRPIVQAVAKEFIKKGAEWTESTRNAIAFETGKRLKSSNLTLKTVVGGAPKGTPETQPFMGKGSPSKPKVEVDTSPNSSNAIRAFARR